ncbi:MAG: Eco57I restriction-modification methylase domain-containing protein, partial [Euryarchaeota archaeon]|nr:Eco57I restriction-modification methylase domain-containing protein [Euryarchaeota archaeon]
MQRNLIAKFLEKNDRDAALVAFYGDEPEDWRFSFVKMEYELVKEDGKVKPKTKLTPAKRSSYLVGLNEPNHTCRTQFLDIIREEDIKPTLEQIEAAFSIETVTKEFFTEYKKIFLDLKESLEEVIKNDPVIEKEFNGNNILTTDFAKKLLGQIVFIYFLQKKGWLGVKRQESWGNGPKNFLRKLFDGEMGSYENFFNDMLEPLLYEALATERDGDYYSKFDCRIPFLNGGLFEPLNDYDWAGTDITLDNKIFKEILDTFDLFNFTIKEDEPLEKEVAVDPEMLGKVFENLLEVTDRKSKGAFYTPREIVHYMCQQSLINYLETNLADISHEDIEYFIKKGEFTLDLIIKEQEQKKKYGTSVKYKTIPEAIRLYSSDINQLLIDIKVVDPAVGSGAFPVGMMNEIVRARSILSILSEKETKNYDLKRETIENCLYGVDIDSSAVDITKLRFWLSLVVDEEEIGDIKPLPNLDHKIMCGNSLIEEFEGMKLFDDKLLEIPKINPDLDKIITEKKYLENELKKLMANDSRDFNKIANIDNLISKLRKKAKKLSLKSNKNSQSNLFASEAQKKLKLLKEKHELFFNAESPNKKKKLRKQIESIEWQFIEETLKGNGNEEAIDNLKEYKKKKSKPFFIWKLYFAEVFQNSNPGFDIVIGNPPYVNIYKISQNKGEVEYFKKIYETAHKKFDLYVLFIEKSISLLKDNGSFAFIIPDKFANQPYGLKLREFILNNCIMNQIVDLTPFKIFEGAVNTPIILILRKENNSKLRMDNYLTVISPEYPNEIHESTIRISKIPQSIFFEIPDYKFRFNLNEDVIPIIKKIENNSIDLGDICYINWGTRSVPQSKFHLKEQINENCKPLIVGKNLDKYVLDYDGLWLHYDVSELYNPMFPELFENEKIIIRDISGKKGILAAYDNSGFYTSHTTSCCQLKHQLKNIIDDNKGIENSKNFDLRFILCLMNSKLVDFYFKMMISSGIHVYLNDLRALKIPLIDFNYKSQLNEEAEIITQLNHDLIYETNIFKKWLEDEFKIEKFSNKLNKFYELSFNEILNELKKKKVDIVSNEDKLKNKFLNSMDIIEPILTEIKIRNNK